VTGRPRDELVEARADFILVGAQTAKAFAEHFEAQIHGGEFEAQMHSGEFEAQMNRGKVRKLLAPLRIFCRKGVILLAVMLAPCALLGYAAFTAGPAPVMLSGVNGVAAVNTASGRLVAMTPLPGPPGAVSAADGSVTAIIPVGRGPAALAAGPGSVWVAHQGSGTVCRIDPRTDQVTASVSVASIPTALATDGGRIWTGIQRTAVTADGNTGVKFPGFPRG
jgi:YVTN family beta-propeller protein